MSRLSSVRPAIQHDVGIDAPPLPPLPANLSGVSVPSTAQSMKEEDLDVAGHQVIDPRTTALDTEVVEMELNLNQPDDFHRRDRSNSITMGSPMGSPMSRGTGTANSRRAVSIHAQLRDDYNRRARVHSSNMIHQQLRDIMDSMQQSMNSSSESILALVSKMESESHVLRRENDRLQAQVKTARARSASRQSIGTNPSMERTIDSSQSLRVGTPMSLDKYESCFHISGAFTKLRSERAASPKPCPPEPKLREAALPDPAEQPVAEPVIAQDQASLPDQDTEPLKTQSPRPQSSSSKERPLSPSENTPVVGTRVSVFEEAPETEAVLEEQDKAVEVKKQKEVITLGVDDKKRRGARSREPPTRRAQIHSRLSHEARTYQARVAVKQERQKAVFASAAEMKDKIRDAIGNVKYNVFDKYKSRGWAQRIARSREFDYTTMFVITFNALWMSIETDYNDVNVIIRAPLIFLLMETFFCVYFLAEVVIRWCAFRLKCDALKDYNFLFDSVLVITMYGESWGLSLFSVLSGDTEATDVFDPSILRLIRLVRIFRIARVVRLLKNMPELMVLIKGMVTATRSVFFTLCLLALILYVFGITFTSLIGTSSVGEKYFSTVGATMNSLLLHGCFLEDFPVLAKEVLEESPLMYVLLISFVLLATLTVMNMLIGVLVEVVSVVATVEKEQLTVNFMKDKMCFALQTIGKLHDPEKGDLNNLTISKTDFLNIIGLPTAARVLSDVGVDVVGLVDLADYLFQDDVDLVSDELPFTEFMDLMLQMRGNNTATVRDLVELRKYLKLRLGNIERHVLDASSTSRPDTGAPARLQKAIREW